MIKQMKTSYSFISAILSYKNRFTSHLQVYMSALLRNLLILGTPGILGDVIQIAKRSIQCWVCLPWEFLLWLSFFLWASVKDNLASAKSFQ